MSHIFQQRRQQFIGQMAENSIAIFSAATSKVRSRDTEYRFCQDKYFYYLCGFNEPDAVLILISGAKKNKTLANSILYCREKDQLAEIWHGKRLGTQQVNSTLLIDNAIDINKFDSTLCDYLDQKQQFYWAQGESTQVDATISKSLNKLRASERQDKLPPKQIIDWRPVLDEMRLIKSEHEINLIQKAVDISILGHLKAMKSCHVGLMEYQLQANIEHAFAFNGGLDPAYTSIVGSGDNACILHYTENNQQLKDGELVLIDAGAEYQGYAGDITRTLPINGQFSSAQKQLYELVLKSQLAAIDCMQPNYCIQQAQDSAVKVLTQGLVELDILSGNVEALIEEQAYKAYFMHGIGHWLGLDVHDVGCYGGSKRDRVFEAGMVLTVEPGLYISKTAEVPKQFKGIGIRIEDNVLISKSGHKVLSQALPKTIEDIEMFMRNHQQAPCHD